MIVLRLELVGLVVRVSVAGRGVLLVLLAGEVLSVVQVKHFVVGEIREIRGIPRICPIRRNVSTTVNVSTTITITSARGQTAAFCVALVLVPYLVSAVGVFPIAIRVAGVVAVVANTQ